MLEMVWAFALTHMNYHTTIFPPFSCPQEVLKEKVNFFFGYYQYEVDSKETVM